MFDSNQPIVEKRFGETYDLPAIHYPQILELVMGLSPKELVIDELKVKTEQVQKIIEQVA